MKNNDIVAIESILEENSYPGRGIVTGLSANGKYAVCAYFIMGRSQNSRNRVFITEGSDLRTAAFDESKLEDPSLIIYYPVRKLSGCLIVTNGDQTDTIRDFIVCGKSFEDALQARCFEPDRPNFTPRISTILNFDKTYSYKQSILKASDSEGTGCTRITYSFEPSAGVGHFIHTYKCDGNPIPSFEGEPEVVSVPDDIDSFTDSVWESLNSDNKISLFVRYTELESGRYETRVINKNC